MSSSRSQPACSATRAGDIVARLGGDELVVIQAKLHDQKMVEDFARRLMDAAVPPVTFREQEILPGITIGVALAPSDVTCR